MRSYANWRGTVFSVTWLTYAGYYLCRKNFAVSKASLIGDYGFSNIELGWVDTAFLAAYALGQFINGPLGDRFGPKRVVVSGLILSAVVNIAFGFSAALGAFILFYGINGYAQSTGWPGMVKTFANWFSKSERGTLMGIWGTCYQIGGAGATAFATLMIADFGWRWAYYGPAVFMLGITALYFATVKSSPADAGLPPVEVYKNEPEASRSGGAPQTNASSGSDDHDSKGVFLEVLTNPSVWILGTTYFFLKLVRYALLFWLPLYMVQELKYELVTAGYLSVVFEVAGFGGSVFAGFVSDKFFGSRRGPIAALMLLGLAGSCFAFSGLASLGTVYLAVGMGLLGFMIYGPDTILSGTGAIDLGSRRGASTAAGIINGLGSIGPVIQGIFIGWFSAKFGWSSLFTVFVFAALASGMLMLTRWNAQAKH